MFEEPLSIYKLIVLYMLGRVNFPLTKAQIMDFILNREYVNFLTLQQTLGELQDDGMIEIESLNNRTYLSITAAGHEALQFFRARLSDELKEEIDSFFLANELELRNEVSVLSNYYRASSGEYEAHLVAKDKNITLVDIKLSVPNEETAVAICENWQAKNQEIYAKIVEMLF